MPSPPDGRPTGAENRANHRGSDPNAPIIAQGSGLLQIRKTVTIRGDAVRSSFGRERSRPTGGTGSPARSSGREFTDEVLVMPVVVVKLYEGRTIEQKRAAAQAITQVVVETLKTTAEHTQVIFEDVKKSDWAIAGKLASD